MTAPRAAHSAARATSARPRLETLEDRTLLDAAPGLDLSALSLDPGRYDPSNILVRFRAGATPQALPGTTLGESHDLVPGLYTVRLSPGASVAGALAAYRHSPLVAYAEPDSYLHVAWTPSDPRYPEQYDMHNTGQTGGTAGADIRAPLAWGLTTGSRRTAVAVVDTGVDYTHPDLYLNIWINQGEIPASRKVNLIDVDSDQRITFRDLNDPRNQGAGKITDLNHNGYIDGGDLLTPMVKDASGHDAGTGGWADGLSNDGDRYVDDIIGWNFPAGTNNPMDSFGHGTHVAGTIGAVSNNGVGVAGVAWQVQLAPLKVSVLNTGFISLQGIIDALDYASAKGIRISNNSWEISSYSQVLFDAMSRARLKGQILVVAAGNSSQVNIDNSPQYPASFNLDNIVAVAATDNNDRLAGFSSWGPRTVDIAAPGAGILSTLPGNRYGFNSGTSMAAPHVAGAIALIWSLRPEWTYQQVIQWLLQTADRIPTLTGKVASGRLNLYTAVRVPPRTTTTTTAAVSAATAGVPLSPSSLLAAGMGVVSQAAAQPDQPLPSPRKVEALDATFAALGPADLEQARKGRRPGRAWGADVIA